MSSFINKLFSKPSVARPSNHPAPAIKNTSEQPSAFASESPHKKTRYGSDVHDSHYIRLKAEVDKISGCCLGIKIKVVHIIRKIQQSGEKSECIDKLNSLAVPSLLSDVFIDEISHFARHQGLSWFGDTESIKNILKNLCGDDLDNIQQTIDEHNRVDSFISSFKSNQTNVQSVEDKSVFNLIFSLSNEEIVPQNFKAPISLHMVLWMENKEDAFKLISKRDDARKMSKNLAGQTLLHLAVKRGHPKIVKWLMPSRLPKAMFDKDENNKTPFDYALETDHTQIIFLFLLRMSHDEINTYCKDNKMPRFKGMDAGSILAIIGKAQLWFEDDLNTQDKNGQTPLHRILTKDKLYIEHIGAGLPFPKMSEATIKAKDKDGKTAFYYAIIKARDIEVAKFLLSKLTEEEANDQCEMAFDYLMPPMSQVFIESIKLILPRVPKNTLRHYASDSPIEHVYLIEDSLRILDKVEEIQSNTSYPINPDDLLNDSITASEDSDLTLPSKKIPHELLNIIHSYTEINNLQDALRYLKTRGLIDCEEAFFSLIIHYYDPGRKLLSFIFKLFDTAKINAQDENKQTLLHLAVNLLEREQTRMEKISELPIFKTFNPTSINTKSKNEQTPLSLSSEQKHIKIIAFLISKMSDKSINAKDTHGNTALYYAVENANIEITKLLIPKIPAEELDDQCDIILKLLSKEHKYVYRPNPQKLAKLMLSSVPRRTLENYRQILDNPPSYDYKYEILHFINDFFTNSTILFDKIEEIQSNTSYPIDINDLLDDSITAPGNPDIARFLGKMPEGPLNIIHSYTEVNSLQDALRYLKIRGFIACEDHFLYEIMATDSSTIKRTLSLIFNLFFHEKRNAQDAYGRTLLHLVTESFRGRNDYIQKMVELPIFKIFYPTIIKGKDKNEQTSISLANQHKFIEIKIVKFLLSKMSDEAINAKDLDDKTAFHYVLLNQNIEITKLLIPKTPNEEVNKQCKIALDTLMGELHRDSSLHLRYFDEIRTHYIEYAKLIIPKVPKQALKSYKDNPNKFPIPNPFQNQIIFDHNLINQSDVINFINNLIENSNLLLDEVERIQSNSSHSIQTIDALDEVIQVSGNSEHTFDDMPSVLLNTIHFYDEINDLQDALRHLKIRGLIPCENTFLNLIFNTPHEMYLLHLETHIRPLYLPKPQGG